MEKEQLKAPDREALAQYAMKIILAAGDGRTNISNAFKAALNGDFVEADRYVEAARGNIQLAHNVQTEIIAMECSGEWEITLSMLFCHAQDTMMTIQSEITMTMQMIEILKMIKESK